MTTHPEFEAWLQARRREVDDRLERLLADRGTRSPALREAMHHALLLGGKRVRPALAVAACDALEGPAEAGILVGAAVELVHAYSLVHDDLPAMDNDDLRRGQPTVHVKHGEAMAILAGDALLTLAFELLATAPELESVGADARVQLIAALADAGGDCGMVDGQALDMSATGTTIDLEALMELHRRKTGALIRASVQMGGMAAGADAEVREALGRYGAALGLMFQITDDLLDAEQSTEQIGKPAGADVRESKSTYVTLLSANEARSHARAAADAANLALGALPATGRLADFITWIEHRDH